MPSDASIYSMMRPIQQQEGPLDRYAKGVQIGSMMNQQEMQGLQLDQARAGAADDQAVRQAYQQAGGDRRRLRDILQSQGQYKAIQSLDKADLEIREKESTIGKNIAATKKDENAVLVDEVSRISSILSLAKDQESYTAIRKAIMGMHPDRGQKMPEQFDQAYVQAKIAEGQTIAQRLADMRAQQQQSATQTNADRTDARVVSEGALNREAMANRQRIPAGFRVKEDGTQEFIPGGPADPKNIAKRPLSSTAQKELFESDDVANSAKNAIDILQSIIAKDPKTQKSQNDLAYEGGTAGTRRSAMAFVPGNYPAENATVDLTNKVTGQALESLRAIFGGMPTEGERKILIELQGSVNQKAQQREAIFKRAIDLAQKRMAFAQDKGKRLREGTYFGVGAEGETNAPTFGLTPNDDGSFNYTGGGR